MSELRLPGQRAPELVQAELSNAAAQLAILTGPNPDTLLADRMAATPDVTDSSEVLSPAERELLPGATAVVQAIFRAAQITANSSVLRATHRKVGEDING